MDEITEAEAREILTALTLHAHYYRIKGTSHQADVQELHEKLRVGFVKRFGWAADDNKLHMTDLVATIRSGSLRGI